MNSNLRCPYHGVELKKKGREEEIGGVYYSILTCYIKGEGKHKVELEDRQSIEQEGVITILLQ